MVTNNTGNMDTSAAVETLFRRRLLEKSGAERLGMACDMFDSAIGLIVSSLPPEVTCDPIERRVAIFQRMYGPERNEPLFKSVVATLRLGSGR